MYRRWKFHDRTYKIKCHERAVAREKSSTKWARIDKGVDKKEQRKKRTTKGFQKLYLCQGVQ